MCMPDYRKQERIIFALKVFVLAIILLVVFLFVLFGKILFQNSVVTNVDAESSGPIPGIVVAVTRPFLHEEPVSPPYVPKEEKIVIEPKSKDEVKTVLPLEKVLFEYVEVTGGCGIHFEGDCLNVRSGPGTDYPSVAQLRNNIVLKVGGKVERDGHLWYQIIFDEWLRYPERVSKHWYVIAEYVQILYDEGNKTVEENGTATSTKIIVVDRTKQMLYAYDGDTLFMEEPISTGLELTPTPRGAFSIYKKIPSRYMQGPIPGISGQYYDLSGVPWNLYFTEGGAAIHGAYWHDNFGKRFSHGCVNLPPDKARKLYNWAELGTPVIVKN